MAYNHRQSLMSGTHHAQSSAASYKQNTTTSGSTETKEMEGKYADEQRWSMTAGRRRVDGGPPLRHDLRLVSWRMHRFSMITDSFSCSFTLFDNGDSSCFTSVPQHYRSITSKKGNGGGGAVEGCRGPYLDVLNRAGQTLPASMVPVQSITATENGEANTPSKIWKI